MFISKIRTTITIALIAGGGFGSAALVPAAAHAATPTCGQGGAEVCVVAK